VAIERADGYAPELIDSGITRLVNTFGGWETLVRRGDHVLVKPNCICSAPPTQPAQTHPAVILALCRQLLDYGAKPFVGDSPAWGTLHGALRQLGIVDELSRLGVPIVPFKRAVRADNIDGKVFKKLTVDAAALEADAIVNLPKLKAHRQVLLTVVIKNMFGCVNGRRKALWHVKVGGYENYFGRMLVETYDLLRPVINIVDAVVAMEGKGPIKGTPRHVGLLLAATDGPALERVMADLVGLKPARLPTLQAARELGVGTPYLDKIQTIGPDLHDIRIPDFEFPKLMPLGFSFPRWIKGTLKNAWMTHQESHDGM